jgi:(R,R)-butanediol dehydrogenase / meso-butanediol dehydrogenase / diacetyl reductase
MKALRWHGREDVRLEDIDPPGDPGAGEVVLQVLLCGVCGTDLEEVHHGPVAVPVGTQHPLSGRMAPLVLGHEVLGRVVAVGSDVTGIAVDDRVVPNGLYSCESCESCHGGEPTRCTSLASIGLHLDGGMAEQIKVPAWMCAVVPPAVPDRLAILAEPLAVCVRAMRRATIRPTDRIVTIGAGTIGQCTTQLALRETAQTAVVDTKPTRVAAMRRAAPDVAEADPQAHAVADCVFDCAGTDASLATALRMVAAGGRIVLVGAAEHASDFSPLRLALKEASIVTSLSHDLDQDLRPAIALLSERELDLEHVVTDVVSLADAALGVFGAGAHRGSASIKTVLDPTVP